MNYLLSMYYVTGTVRFFPHNCYYSHFIDVETDAGRLRNLSKAMKLANNHIRFKIWFLSKNHALNEVF